jgi:hypothetical protein
MKLAVITELPVHYPVVQDGGVAIVIKLTGSKPTSFALQWILLALEYPQKWLPFEMSTSPWDLSFSL